MQRTLIHLGLTILVQANLFAQVQTVAVLPFADLSNNQKIRWLSESFPELIEERLKSPKFKLKSREERLEAFARMGVPYSSTPTKATLIKIGQELGADVLILGDFKTDRQRLQVVTSMLDLRKSVLSSPFREQGSVEDLQPICSRLSWQILRGLEPAFSLTREAFSLRFQPIPNIALESYLRGVLESDRRKQMRFFQEADKACPNYGKAVFHLGKIYYEMKDYSNSSLWLQKLGNSRYDFPEATFLLGLDNFHLKNYERAVSEFQKLSDQFPMSEVNNNLAISLSLHGQNQEATRAFERALVAAPSSPDLSFNLAYHLWKTGSFGRAIQILREVCRSTEDGEACYLLYKSLKAIGRPAEANEAWALARQHSAQVTGWEERRQMPELFRIQSHFSELSFRQLQPQILENGKRDIEAMPN